MAASPQARQMDPRMLRQLLIAMYLQEAQGGGQQQPQRQQPSTIDQLIQYYDKGKRLYNLGQSGYNLYNRWFGDGATPTPTGTPTSAPTTSTPQTPTTGTGTTTAPTTEGSSFSWADAAPYVNTATSIYNAYKLLNNKNMDKDQRNLALAGTAAQASTPWTGGYGAAAAGAFNTGATLMGDGTEEEKTQQAAHQLGMTVANYYTAGLAGLADGYARNQWGGTMKKLDKFRFNTPGTPEWGLMQASKLWDTDAWKKEGSRVKALLEAGVEVPEAFRGRMYQKRGLSKKELVNQNYANDFQGWTKDGYVNNKFENTRNEADMTYETLAPYAVWAEKRNDWWKLSDAQRRAITDAAQKSGAVREHHGTLDVDWNKVGDIDAIIKSAPGAQPAFRRPGKGQVARVSAGMYMNDKGQVSRALTSDAAMKQNYGNRIPKGGRR